MNELLGSDMYARSFNSTLVQLKGIHIRAINIKIYGFNSTLVQLKAWNRQDNVAEYSCFNSTLVQLKVLCIRK